MSRVRARAGWITYYFEYEKFAEYTKRLMLLAGSTVYLISASAAFLFQKGLTTLSIGMTTLYAIALMCAYISGYLLSPETQRKTTSERRLRTFQVQRPQKPRLLAVLTLLTVIVLSYIALCAIL